ncbi:type II secretion system protein [Thermovirga lienii]|uniref:type II secretion system protein n=1 Tax=Thermovirga lienii TaxID=336261 RepID=UPI002FE3CE35
MKKRGGFSVVELLVAVTVISILAVGVRQTATAYFAKMEQNKISEFKADAVSISQGVFYYAFFEGEPPSSYRDLMEQGYLVGDGLSPWGTPYELVESSGTWKVVAADDKGKRHVYAAQAER